MSENLHRRIGAMQNLEENFAKYIDTEDAEKIFDNFFSAIRKAYIAGYKAGLNKKDHEARIIQLVCSDGKDRTRRLI